MMKVRVQSFSAPRWIIPVLFLVALALIPFFFAVALALAAAAVGFTVFRSLLPAPGGAAFGQPDSTRMDRRFEGSGSKVIDADYEVKDENGQV